MRTQEDRKLDYKIQDWNAIESFVAGKQDNIVNAVRKFGRESQDVRDEQKKLIKSWEARALAFRTVYTNKGRKTPGIDGRIFSTDDFTEVIKTLANLRGYKCSPVRRVMIPKSDGKSYRPLGIPTSIDRAWQALFSLALNPIIGEVNCPRSYGYMKYRGCRDAVINRLSS